MHIVLIIAIFFLVILGPQYWARRTFARYNDDLPHMPGTGGELAKHLVERFELTGVRVEITEQGDHYDPQAKAVRLSESNYRGKSLTAVAVAAHEVGHAIQDKEDSPLLRNRTRLIQFAQFTDKAGSIAMLGLPVATLITRSPSITALMLFLGVSSMLVSALVHLITLPVEIDASFKKALPILKQGRYINPEDERAVSKILKAAAYTYVAASLAGILNLARWIAVLRR